MSEETIQIGRWNIPKNLLFEYVKFRVLADDYVMLKPDPSRIVPMSDRERSMRWQMCVQRLMEIHRKICKTINVPYSEEPDDEFYKAFVADTDRRIRRLRNK